MSSPTAQVRPLAWSRGFWPFYARRCSPNTEAAYAFDLTHFFRFLAADNGGTWDSGWAFGWRLGLLKTLAASRNRLPQMASCQHDPAALAMREYLAASRIQPVGALERTVPAGLQKRLREYTICPDQDTALAAEHAGTRPRFVANQADWASEPEPRPSHGMAAPV